MRRALLPVLVAAAACRPPPEAAPDAPPAYDGPRARVATFNVRRLFDAVCDSGACAEGDYEPLPSQADVDARADELAGAIRALEADVIALQEIENEAVFGLLRERLADALPHAAFGETGFAGSVDVAVLARTPIDRVARHREAQPLVLPSGMVTTFSRELLEVETVVMDARIVVFAAHFKAKSNDDPARRLAEAEVSRRVIEARVAETPDAIAILAGDLNDVPGSPPLVALVAERGLVRLADDLSTGAQATYVYRGQGQAIDHLLLAPNRADVRLPQSAEVWNGGATWGYGGSDHAALTADIAVK